jgi:hypothetical protein
MAGLTNPQLAKKSGTLKKGDEYWCMLPRLAEPKKGKIISLSTSTSKQVGLEFDEDVNGHSCDGRGKQGYCLYCRVGHLANDDMLNAMKTQRQNDIDRVKNAEGDEVEEIDLTVGL